MEIIKRYEKFKSYKTAFAIFLTTVTLSSIAMALLYKKEPSLSAVGDLAMAVGCDMRASVFLEICFLLFVFTAGPTIYAPVGSFLATALYGALFGVRCLCADSPFSLGVEIFFSCITAYGLVIYSSFVTLTSLRIFSATKINGKRELFDGVMFRADKFIGIFNLRYVLSYVAFFILFALFISFFSATKVFLLSL